MRILCGVLTGFVCLMLLFFIFASGNDVAALSVVMTFYGGVALVLLWLAGGQPFSFTNAAATEPKTRQRRFRGVMRIAAGVLGVPLAGQIIVIVGDFAWRAVPAARTGTPGSGDFSMALDYLPLIALWWVPQGLAAWVLLRFAFRGRPLPPTKSALTAAAPSAGPPVTGNEARPESGSISVMSGATECA